GVRTRERQHVEPADLRIKQAVGRRLLWAFQQLVAIDDLHDAALVGAEREIDAVALRTGRHETVDSDRYRTGRARLLADQAEVADLDRIGGVAEVVDLRHAGAPAGRRRDQIGDAAFALPVVLVRVGQAHETRQHFGLGRIGHVPDLVAFATERAQQIDFVGIAL